MRFRNREPVAGRGYAAGRRVLTTTNRAAWNITERVCKCIGAPDNVSLSVDELNGEGRGYVSPGELNTIEQQGLFELPKHTTPPHVDPADVAATDFVSAGGNDKDAEIDSLARQLTQWRKVKKKKRSTKVITCKGYKSIKNKFIPCIIPRQRISKEKNRSTKLITWRG